jgi:hypothetical protein
MGSVAARPARPFALGSCIRAAAGATGF